ncbi:MAG TPA: integrase core domain-containing protein [Candidatus Saccharibacteria bacterium]|nr:integrase core domain-containing protein [Candidatus Saccharibacteria bacterium]
MAYSINPNLPRARAAAMRLLVEDQLPLAVVARKCGVHRSTIWRWKRKWEHLNNHWQKDNPNRPSRGVGRSKFLRYSWNIATISSRPHTNPTAVPDEIVRQILAIRTKLNRCAEVVWHHLTTVLGILVSLSSVRRILRRHHCFDGARKPRVRRDNPRRPLPTAPGELVQTDTIHHVDPHSGRKLYYYTVIDLYTRLAYAKIATRVLPGLAAAAVLEARQAFGFSFTMVQSDNGPEYGRYFEQRMRGAGVQTRHSRLHRPNDNAHVERFNRTIQAECIGHFWRVSVPLPRQQAKLTAWLAYYNTERVHLGIQMRTPSEMLQRS